MNEGLKIKVVHNDYPADFFLIAITEIDSNRMKNGAVTVASVQH